MQNAPDRVAHHAFISIKKAPLRLPLDLSVLFVYLYASALLQITEQIRRRLADRLCDLHSGAVRLMRLESANVARCTPALALWVWVHTCVLFASRIVEAGVVGVFFFNIKMKANV